MRGRHAVGCGAILSLPGLHALCRGRSRRVQHGKFDSLDDILKNHARCGREALMGEVTKIEWCHHTYNAWMGCTKVSPACDHCYAEAQEDTRYGRVTWGGDRRRARESNRK